MIILLSISYTYFCAFVNNAFFVILKSTLCFLYYSLYNIGTSITFFLLLLKTYKSLNHFHAIYFLLLIPMIVFLKHIIIYSFKLVPLILILFMQPTIIPVTYLLFLLIFVSAYHVFLHSEIIFSLP